MSKLEIISRDVVATAIAAPIDWLVLEALICAILTADDFPSLRKIGSVGDQGVDAIEESFFNGERKINTVVQVTSQQAQRTKATDTIEKLQKNGIDFQVLLFVTRHPVTSAVRRTMIDDAAEKGVTLEIRDSEYLISQLSKPGAAIIYSRFFGTAQQQLDALLAVPDPLQIADNDPLRHALLASLGAFVLSPHARLARHTLFDNTVLAALASLKGPSTLEQLLPAVSTLVPEEQVDPARLNAAISRLCEAGSCLQNGDRFSCSEQTIAQFSLATQKAQSGYKALLDYIISACKRVRSLSDAQVGYVERNVRRAILHLLRAAGPLGEISDLSNTSEVMEPSAIKSALCRDLPSDVGSAALAAFSSFTKDEANVTLLSPLVRSYSAMAIRNIDPVGRRWQQVALERSCIALDTDAVLSLMIEELPEHKALLSALTALKEHGVDVILPNHVLEEAVGHISRAGTTFRRFATSLLRMPDEMVDAQVWHAIVRGYYYAAKSGYGGTPESFLRKYYDSERQIAYSEHVLSRRLNLRLDDLAQPSEATDPLCFELGNEILANREASRLKAQFRGTEEMSARVYDDVRMALKLADREDKRLDSHSRGYLATEDRAFLLLEKMRGWGGRASIRIATRAVPELANFICGIAINDDDVIRLLFDPVSVAAADQMAADITILTSIGVDLKDTPLDRLEWDLKHDLRHNLDALTSSWTAEAEAMEENIETNPDSSIATLATVKAAKAAGYPLVEPVERLASDYDSALLVADAERKRSQQLEEQLKALTAAALSSTSRKGRRKVNRALRELGIEIEDIDFDTEPDEQ